LNLGTPDAPEPEAVGRYLKQFLMDKRVIDIPWPLRWFLVNVMIVPRRKHLSSENYRTVWTERGSPLLMHLRDLALALESRLQNRFELAIAMRYGNPSIDEGLKALAEKGVKEVRVLPLYPQYAESTTLSSIEECEAAARRLKRDQKIELALEFITSFHDHPEFVAASLEVALPYLQAHKPDHLLFSFHGLPERQLKRVASCGEQCLTAPDCCAVLTERNSECYRAQCFSSARAMATGLGLKDHEWSVSFQSRLGRTPWIRPYTDDVLKELAEQGVRKLAVAMPSFTADCLETLEEIAVRGSETFREHGGESLLAIPCLNSHPRWIEAVEKLSCELPTRLSQAKTDS
jgi:ferrochelatase